MLRNVLKDTSFPILREQPGKHFCTHAFCMPKVSDRLLINLELIHIFQDGQTVYINFSCTFSILASVLTVESLSDLESFTTSYWPSAKCLCHCAIQSRAHDIVAWSNTERLGDDLPDRFSQLCQKLDANALPKAEWERTLTNSELQLWCAKKFNIPKKEHPLIRLQSNFDYECYFVRQTCGTNFTRFNQLEQGQHVNWFYMWLCKYNKQ